MIWVGIDQVGIDWVGIVCRWELCLGGNREYIKKKLKINKSLLIGLEIIVNPVRDERPFGLDLGLGQQVT